MDPLTQGLLGASFGQALYGRALGRRALVWGALVGMTPDLDVLANPVSPMAEWLWHRGPTHALVFGPAVGPAIGWLLWKRKGGRLRDWVGLCVVALFTHPLLDVFTTYGTQLLWPFSRQRFAFDAVAIVDPVYSLALAVALVLGLRWGVRTTLARRAAWTALALSSAYVGLGLAVNARAEALARGQLVAEGVAEARVAAYPTLFQLPSRRVVARSGDEVRVGWVSVARTAPDRLGALPRRARAPRRRGALDAGSAGARVVRDGGGDAAPGGGRDRRGVRRPAVRLPRPAPGRALGRAGPARSRRAVRSGPASGSTVTCPLPPLSSWASSGTTQSAPPDLVVITKRPFYVLCIPLLPFGVCALTVK